MYCDQLLCGFVKHESRGRGPGCGFGRGRRGRRSRYRVDVRVVCKGRREEKVLDGWGKLGVVVQLIFR